MTQVYNVFDGERGTVFKTLKQAHDYIKEHNPKYWVITRHTLVRPTVDSIIKIINSEGGSWSIDSEFVGGS